MSTSTSIISTTTMIDRAPGGLVGYATAEPDDGTLHQRGQLYDYVLAGNGVFIRAVSGHLQVQFQIAECEVRGLPELEDIFQWGFPLIPKSTVEMMLERARQEALVDKEILFHLRFSADCGDCELIIPEQDAGPAHCRPLDSGPDSSHARALIECHSHHEMRAFFSSRDDADEQGFRVYAVMGRVLSEPEIRVRVGCHGYFWDIDAAWVFELPTGLESVIGEAEEADEE